MKKVSFALVIASLILSACDTGSSGLVSVKYVVSSDNGGRGAVSFYVENEEWESAAVEDGWEYEFFVEEGSQLLYITSGGVTRGSIEVGIMVDGEMRSRHRHEAPKSTELTRLSSSAWGIDKDINVFYFLQSGDLSGTQLMMPDGVRTYEQAQTDFGFLQRITEQFFAQPGLAVGFHTTRSSIEEGYNCVWAAIHYEPVPSQDPMLLAQARQCDVAPVDIDITLNVPGY